MIAAVESVKRQTGQAYQAVCRQLDVPYSSLMRWRGHRRAGEAPIGKSGPAKVKPLDFAALDTEIHGLHFARLRTGGIGDLYAAHRSQISRRDLHALVEAVGLELRQKEQAEARRVDWRVPGAVWSMDDMKKHWLQDQPFGHVHAVVDLGSHYHLHTWGGDAPASGPQVAMSLEELFLRFGAPLFLKVDGGANFRHWAVREVLEQFWVMPLVSPPYYPPYNGVIEREHQETLRQLAARIGCEKVSAQVLRLECDLSGHEVNHMRRSSLNGRTACYAMETGRSLLRRFGRRQRKEVFDEIKAMTVDIAERLPEHPTAAAETAFRYAAETWMQLNHIIRVTRNGEVLPPFYRIQSH